MDKNKLESLLISADTTLKEAMRELNKTRERILFVIDGNNKLIGTVNDGDIRRGIINGIDFNDTVEKLMCRNFSAVRKDIPNIKENARQLIMRNKIEQIPVLNDKGSVVDVILWTDILGEKKRIVSRNLYKNQVVIMAGGKGTRLDPFTRILPKPLIPIGDKPIIELIMEKFSRYGFCKFICTLNYKKEYLKLFFKENKFPYSIYFAEEENFLGTAGSLSLLKDRIKDTFFIANCDSLLCLDFEQVLNWHKEQRAVITIIGCHSEIKIPFGVLQMCNGSLKKMLEKPVHDVIVNTGVYLMEPHIISYIPKKKKLDMNILINRVSKNEKVAVYPISEGWFDMGQWNEYQNNLSILKKGI